MGNDATADAKRAFVAVVAVAAAGVVSDVVGAVDDMRTWGDFELRGELDMVASLDCATRGLVRKALEMDDEYRRKSFDEHHHLLVRRFSGARVRWVGLHEVRL